MLGVLAVGRVHSPRGERGAGVPQALWEHPGGTAQAEEGPPGSLSCPGVSGVLCLHFIACEKFLVAEGVTLAVSEGGRARGRLQNLMGLREHVFPELQVPPCVDGGGELGLQTS